MSQCFNPNCLHRNQANPKFCQKCGNKLLLGDRYRAINYIGEGGFGRTFKAIDEKRLDTPCVIKQFLPQQQGSPALQKAEELFKQEAVRLRDLGTHPQIPDLLSFEEQDARFYLVQQFIDGQDLFKELQQRGKFNEAQIRQLLNDLLPVLDFCHQKQVIHRDIKPDNIIRAKNGKLVLIDFGVSKQLTATVLSRIGTVTGSPGYAPPEQMQGQVFPASDLYSLAVTCIRLLTGCLLTETNGMITDELFSPMQMEWVWRQKANVSNELAAILDKMLSFRVGDRYQSAVAVLQALNPSVATPSVAKPSVPSTVISAIPTKLSVAPSVANPPTPANHPSAAKTFHYEVVKLDRNGNISSRETASNRGYTERTNGIEFEMVNIPAGKFAMGSPTREAQREDNEIPQHWVDVPEFFMARTQVTQAQWRVVAQLPKINSDLNPDPSYLKGDNHPVENVSWYDCIEFCARLSQKTGKNYRLPSEAEWEYACRAGTTTPFHFGETISPKVANYRGNYTYGSGKKGEYRGQTIPVGSLKAANAWGLYDMHGNVLEWCLDDWHDNYTGAPTNGLAWLTENDNDYHFEPNWIHWLKKIFTHKNNKLLRGGRWRNGPGHCRSAYRRYGSPGSRFSAFGFRFVVSLPRT
jgi:formylglycine-generating enzyme required for sulfatase activity/tRNA A-37 threonylcarbamoyl transferase component Bud32